MMVFVIAVCHLPLILSIHCIYIQGICGYIFSDGMMTGPHYDVHFLLT